MRVFGICFMAVSFLALSGAATQQQTATPSTDQGQSFSLSISASKRTFNHDEDVNVTVTVTNVSDHNILVGSDLGGVIAPFSLDVRDSTGKPVPRIQLKPGSTYGGSFVSIPLKPGQSTRREENLKKEFTISKPGSYTVQASREDYKPSGHQVRSHVKSNILAINITE